MGLNLNFCSCILHLFHSGPGVPKPALYHIMAHRIITQVIFTGTRVVGRAFAEAYKQPRRLRVLHLERPHPRRSMQDPERQTTAERASEYGRCDGAVQEAL